MRVEERREVAVRRASLSARQRALVVLEGVVSLAGAAGGFYMATHPLTMMPLSYLEGTWFHTWRWPGLALFFFVGVVPSTVVLVTLQGRRVATIGHLGVGAGLVAWNVLEALWIVVAPPLQVLFAVIGVAIFWLGLAEWRHASPST